MPELQYEWLKKNDKASVEPPSKVLKTFVKEHEIFSENDVEFLAKKCLLAVSDVQMWLQNVYNMKKRKGKRLMFLSNLIHVVFVLLYIVIC